MRRAQWSVTTHDEDDREIEMWGKFYPGSPQTWDDPGDPGDWDIDGASIDGDPVKSPDILDGLGEAFADEIWEACAEDNYEGDDDRDAGWEDRDEQDGYRYDP